MADHSTSGLSLSLTLSCSCDQHTVERTRKLADGSNLSCELVLSTPSCIYNGTRLPQTPRSRPDPMEVVVEEHSSCDNTALLLELSLSWPSYAKQREPIISAGEELSAASDSTLLSCLEMPTELESVVPGQDFNYLRYTSAGGAAHVDAAEGSNPPPPPPPPPPSNNRAGELQPAPRGTWEETVQRLKGTDPVRVLTKRLVSTDVSRDHTRFLFTKDEEDKRESHPQEKKQKEEDSPERGPRKLLDMLTGAEKAAARADGGLPVLLLDRWGNRHPGNKLRFWKGNKSYVILGRWPQFVQRYELEVGDVVDVYIFRAPPEAAAPYLAGPPSSSSSSSSSSAPPPSSEARAQPATSGPQGEDWRLAIVVCSSVPLEEEERRRRESPEAKETRRRQKEGTAGTIERKRKRTNVGSRVQAWHPGLRS